MAKREKLSAADAARLGSEFAGYGIKVTAELPDPWDFSKKPVLEGTVQTIQTVTLEDLRGVRKARVAHVTNKDGTFGLWESATLVPLFNDLKQGDDVKVRFIGLGEAKPGRSAPKLFMGGIKQHG